MTKFRNATVCALWRTCFAKHTDHVESASDVRSLSIHPGFEPVIAAQPHAWLSNLAIPVLFATRNTWVSTASVGFPNAIFNTTLAVFRPTPGNADRVSIVFGTTPSYSSNKMRHVSIICFAFAFI